MLGTLSATAALSAYVHSSTKGLNKVADSLSCGRRLQETYEMVVSIDKAGRQDLVTDINHSRIVKLQVGDVLFDGCNLAVGDQDGGVVKHFERSNGVVPADHGPVLQKCRHANICCWISVVTSQGCEIVSETMLLGSQLNSRSRQGNETSDHF